jgi:maltose-binding protein MalE
MSSLSRRRLLRATGRAAGALAMGTTLATMACVEPRRLYGFPTATPLGTPPARSVRLWLGDATHGERVMTRQVLPLVSARMPGIDIAAIHHSSAEDLVRVAVSAYAGGVGPDVLSLPGEWLGEPAVRRLVAPLPPELAALGEPTAWLPRLVESGRWAGVALGLPAAPIVRQPFFNDTLLRDVGLISLGRTTPPSTWAEFADVSQRVARPEDRWGSLLPSRQADADLYLHVMQHVLTAGGDLPVRVGDRVAYDTPAAREALAFLQDLQQSRGALPLDRPPYRQAEEGRIGLWWTTSRWIGERVTVGNEIRAGATLVPRGKRGGAIVRARHWCIGARSSEPDLAVTLLGSLIGDEVSHRYCAGLSLPPVRRANAGRAEYTRPGDGVTGQLWRAVLAQLGHDDNVAYLGFPGIRAATARMAGEFLLVLSGKKPIPDALGEGEGGVGELLQKIPAGGV